MGTMVGGASTIGTAQVAFRDGLSARGWCLSAGIEFVVLASGLGRRLYETGATTVPQLLARSYGDRSRPIVAVFTSLGIFFSFIGNSLAFVALCSSTLHGALFFPQFVTHKAGIAAACLGPLTTFLWHVMLPKGLDPLYPGLAVSFVVLAAVSLLTPRISPDRSLTCEVVEPDTEYIEK